MKKIMMMSCLALLSAGVWQSCTNLDEEIYSSIPSEAFFQSEEEFLMSAGRVYAHLMGYTHYYNIWGTITVSTDEALTPMREFNQWLDGGVWRDLHAHTWSVEHDNIFQTWEWIFGGVSLCNQIIYEFEQASLEFDVKDAMIAEIKTMRAWFYYQAMDLFGGVPLSTDFTDVELPQPKSRADIFAFVESELLANVDMLADSPRETYGRATKPMAYMILAKMYLNHDKWFGTPKWDEAVAACDKIIALNTLELESDYFANFRVDNTGSRENIFAIVYDKVYAAGDWWTKFRFHQLTLHWEYSQIYNIPEGAWNGFCTSESFYETFDHAGDAREAIWLAGPQTKPDGSPLMWYDTQVDHTPHINSLYDATNPAGHTQGVRFAKYEYESDLTGECMSNDYVVFRYADVLMTKGEALVRKGDAAGALPLFNEVRARTGLASYTADQLTLDEIYAERGREFVWEGSRRQDMIRFGKWTAARDFKAAEADNHTELFPIPSRARQSNPNLGQNPGY